MKSLKINYDVMDKIQSATKINKCPKFAKICIMGTFTGVVAATFLAKGFSIDDQIMLDLIAGVSSYFCVDIATMFSNVVCDLIMGENYMTWSKNNLSTLAIRLKDIGIKTDLELLLKSHEYHRSYKLAQVNGHIPSILECKYINIPSYNQNNKVSNTSVVQSHIVGSSLYQLSTGQHIKNKSLKKVLA